MEPDWLLHAAITQFKAGMFPQAMLLARFAREEGVGGPDPRLDHDHVIYDYAPFGPSVGITFAARRIRALRACCCSVAGLCYDHRRAQDIR